jgi:hypothetical protein
MSLIWEVLFGSRFLWVRIFAAISVLSSLLTLVTNSIEFSCQLSIVQNILLPFFGTLLLLSELKLSNRTSRIKIGVSAAVLIGMISALSLLILSNIHYYFLGGIETAFTEQGMIVPPLTLRAILVGIGSDIWILIILTFVSAITGLIAAAISGRDSPR